MPHLRQSIFRVRHRPPKAARVQLLTPAPSHSNISFTPLALIFVHLPNQPLLVVVNKLFVQTSIMVEYVGLTVGLTLAGSLIFIPILVALWSCRRDLMPSWCTRFIDRDDDIRPQKMTKQERRQPNKLRKGQHVLDIRGNEPTERSHTRGSATDEP
jgi:hypothetical protein